MATATMRGRGSSAAKSEPWSWSHALIYIGAPLLLITLHAVCIQQYGFFRDELYYLACAKHLTWGYVDHPPLSIAVLKVMVDWLGPELWVVRIPGIAAAALGCVFTALTTRTLGGGIYAQGLAAIAFALTPVYLVVGHMYSMNSLDVAIWPMAAALFAVVLRKPSGAWWLLLGLVLGAALLNKLSGGWLIVGLGLGLVLTDQRKQLKTIWPWLCVLIALGIAAPHFWWQHENGWPTLEFMRNAYEHKMVAQPIPMLLGVQAVVMNPLALPLWFVGLYALFGMKELKPYRALAFVFLFVFVLVLVGGKARPNYMAPAFVMLLAPAAVALEGIGEKKGWGWLRSGLTALTVLGGVVLLPLSLPLLPVPTLERVIAATGVDVPAEEKGRHSNLQGYADMFGWPELSSAVRAVWDDMDPTDQEGCAIITPTYGEAAGLEHFWPDAPVPIISGHNNYWLWGREGWEGRTAILINPSQEVLEKFESVEKVGQVDAPYAVPSLSDAPIYLARGLRESVDEFWNEIRVFE